MMANASAPIPGLDTRKARRYRRVRLAVVACSVAWTVARLLWYAGDRRALRFQRAIDRLVPVPRLAPAAFLALSTALGWVSGLPVALIGGYLVERRFGLTRQSARGWFEDQVKGALVGLALQTPLLVAAFALIRRRPRDWWLILPAAALPVTIVFGVLAPVLLMPIFNRFTRLRDEELARRLRELAARNGVVISDVFEMDMSRQTDKPNAMFAGIGHSKRIVLGDTMLEHFPADEIETVVAHELGHQVHGDIWRLIGFGAASTFGAAWLASRLAPVVLRGTSRITGVADIGDEASLPILSLVVGAIGASLMPWQAAFSRWIERRADRFAVAATGDGEAYARALERLAARSLADPDPPRWEILWNYSHPPIGERIRAARAAASEADADIADATKTTDWG
jgi:STE24 endopeptidase